MEKQMGEKLKCLCWKNLEVIKNKTLPLFDGEVMVQKTIKSSFPLVTDESLIS